jgi:hypothetical protein
VKAIGFPILILAAFIAQACAKKEEEALPLANCGAFLAASPGVVALTQSGGSVTVDWTTDISSVSEKYSVRLTGPSTPAAIQNTKPASFSGLADGSWTAIVTHEKAGCTDQTISKTFVVDSTVNCTTWNSQSVGTIAATPQSGAGSSINWSGVITGQSSFQVVLSGNNSGTVSNAKPAIFSGLSSGSTTATVTYSKTACSDLTGSQSFTVPVSLSAHIYPVLSSKCAGCHPGQGNFSTGASATDLHTILTTTAFAGSCSPAAASSQFVNVSVDPGNPTQSFFYRRVNTTNCGNPPMATTGGLTAGEVSDILNWIANGANND